jgi:hypothetical protein
MGSYSNFTKEQSKCTGGLTYTFLEPQLPDNIIEDMTKLYIRLVDLGMEYRNGNVYLADLEDQDV